MILPISKTRKIMGKKANKYSDKELEEVVNVLTILADLAIDSYLAKQKIKKQS